ncbi:FbpB family small basic protein [Pontibacillus salicampi]|uniref:FbpB family small basic protein n=1 Tax=Pontibacillus salicampi TaxID=1449801 RepID=A0ABV6LIQ0_9BACI
MRSKTLSFEALVQQNKKAIQADKRAMSAVEKRLDQRHMTMQKTTPSS